MCNRWDIHWNKSSWGNLNDWRLSAIKVEYELSIGLWMMINIDILTCLRLTVRFFQIEGIEQIYEKIDRYWKSLLENRFEWEKIVDCECGKSMNQFSFFFFNRKSNVSYPITSLQWIITSFILSPAATRHYGKCVASMQNLNEAINQKGLVSVRQQFRKK